MDQAIITEKLESLRRCIKRIEDKKPSWGDLLSGDPDIQDIIVLNLSRAVQLCVDVGSHIVSETEESAPRSMGEIFSILETLDIISPETCRQLKKAVGFRNVAVHNYRTINWEMVYAICNHSLDDFRRFAREISHYAQV
jgi:uncharacterized protein YutE (UPF0331/DUF86 family)